ncbi:MAG: c-type cytochrome [Bryobacterales bacterium]|nr:c-type cytochrome [Bryobacterales bacterium]
MEPLVLVRAPLPCQNRVVRVRLEVGSGGRPPVYRFRGRPARAGLFFDQRIETEEPSLPIDTIALRIPGSARTNPDRPAASLCGPASGSRRSASRLMEYHVSMSVPRLCWLMLLPSLLAAQSRDRNPHTSPKDVAEGRRMYALFCVFCHGMDGASGRGARLATTFRRHGTSDLDQYRVIANGVPGTEMSGHFLEEEEIWRILAFVRTLERATPHGACATGPGSVGAGRTSFVERGCLGCHSVGAEGSGRLGPDLNGIGAARTREHLRDSLSDPGRSVAPGYRTVLVTVRNGGGEVRGVLLTQDEYTVHLMDGGERIRSFRREELSGIQFPGGSNMPAYAALAGTEMDSLLSYLCSLQGGALR